MIISFRSSSNLFCYWNAWQYLWNKLYIFWSRQPVHNDNIMLLGTLCLLHYQRKVYIEMPVNVAYSFNGTLGIRVSVAISLKKSWLLYIHYNEGSFLYPTICSLIGIAFCCFLKFFWQVQVSSEATYTDLIIPI